MASEALQAVMKQDEMLSLEEKRALYAWLIEQPNQEATSNITKEDSPQPSDGHDSSRKHE